MLTLCETTAVALSDRLTLRQVLDRAAEKVGERFRTRPLTEAAFAAGEISSAHASLIARTASDLGDRWDLQAEEILVTAAKELDPGRLRYATLHLRHCLEPDGVLADANKAYERRFVHLSETFEGIYRLDVAD